MQQVLQLFDKCLCNGKKVKLANLWYVSTKEFLQKELKYLVDGRNSSVKLVVTWYCCLYKYCDTFQCLEDIKEERQSVGERAFYQPFK